MTVDSKEFRNTVGCFATGITVITTLEADGTPVGLTANSFTSLSLDPPMVLFCLDRKIQSFDAFIVGGGFGINILSAEQKEVSKRFAESGPEKWVGFEYDKGQNGCPILRGCLANLEGCVTSLFDGGDHVIVAGEVKNLVSSGLDVKPIIFYRGGYADLSC